jgi:hypothetical protein
MARQSVMEGDDNTNIITVGKGLLTLTVNHGRAESFYPSGFDFVYLDPYQYIASDDRAPRSRVDHGGGKISSTYTGSTVLRVVTSSL